MRNLLPAGCTVHRKLAKIVSAIQKGLDRPKSANYPFLLLRSPTKSLTTPGVHVHGKSERRFRRHFPARDIAKEDLLQRHRDPQSIRYARTHRRTLKTRMPARPSHSSAPKQPRRVPHLVDKKDRWGKVQTGMRESSCESTDSEIDFNGASNTEITTAPVAVSSVVRFPSPSSKTPRLPPLPSRQKGPLPQLDDGGTD